MAEKSNQLIILNEKFLNEKELIIEARNIR